MGVRRAAIYARRRDLFLFRVDTTSDGIGILTDDVVKCAATVEADRLGSLILQVLFRSRRGIRGPRNQREWDVIGRAALDAVGARSWAAFVRGTREVSIEEDEGVITFKPMINLGPRAGFGAREGHETKGHRDDPIEVGTRALRAIELALDAPPDSEPEGEP